MKKIIKWLLWAIFALAVLGTFAFLWSNGQPKEASYEILSTTEGDSISKQVVLTGSIKPRNEVNIKSQIAGIISEILVEAGQEVKMGDVIARISVVPDISQLNSAEHNLEQARIAQARLKEVHLRDKELFDKGLLAAEEYERSQAEYKNASIQLSAAKEALDIIRKGTSARLSKESSTLVKATISGRILDIPVKVGSQVIPSNNFNDGTTIATVANMQDLIFSGNADETEVGKLSVGQDMLLSVGALPDLKLEARVEYISPQGTASGNSQVFEVRGAMTSLSGEVIARLRSGYSANAQVFTARVTNVLTIPESALSYRADSTFVLVVLSQDPLKTQERAVTLGLSDGGKVEVKSGLEGGELLRGPEQSL